MWKKRSLSKCGKLRKLGGGLLGGWAGGRGKKREEREDTTTREEKSGKFAATRRFFFSFLDQGGPSGGPGNWCVDRRVCSLVDRCVGRSTRMDCPPFFSLSFLEVENSTVCVERDKSR